MQTRHEDSDPESDVNACLHDTSRNGFLIHAPHHEDRDLEDGLQCT